MWANERKYDSQIFSAAGRYSVPIAALMATAGIESSFQPNALNSSDPGGAWGMFQMIPTTARGLGFQGNMEQLQSDVQLSADLAAKLWSENLNRAGGDVLAAASAYNGGWRPSMGYGAKVNGRYANQSYVDRFWTAYVYFQDVLAGKVGAVPETASFRRSFRDRVTAGLASTTIPQAVGLLSVVFTLSYLLFRWILK